MAAPSRQRAVPKAPAAARRKAVRLAGVEDLATPSPALHQQTVLSEQWAASEAHAAAGPRWSARRTLAFIGLTCGAFWAVVAFAILRLAH